MDRYLAIDEEGNVSFEDSLEAIRYAMANSFPIKYYRVVLDEWHEPTLEEVECI